MNDRERTPTGSDKKYRRILRFHVYKRATDTSSQWFKWGWNEYREVLTPDGVGVRLGCSVQVGMRVFGLQWKERVRRVR